MYQKVVSTGFLLNEQKALVIRRSMDETFLPGYFELPGGKVDFGEDPKESLEREYREEVNLQIKIGDPFKVFSYVSGKGDRHTVEILFHVFLLHPDQEVKLSPAHEEYRWITQNEMHQFLISPEIKDGIIQGFRTR